MYGWVLLGFNDVLLQACINLTQAMVSGCAIAFQAATIGGISGTRFYPLDVIERVHRFVSGQVARPAPRMKGRGYSNS